MIITLVHIMLYSSLYMTGTLSLYNLVFSLNCVILVVALFLI
jgi:hypothetical protein